jgi:hypothetical protein
MGVEVVWISAEGTGSSVLRAIRRRRDFSREVSLSRRVVDVVGREVREGTAERAVRFASERRGLGVRRSLLATIHDISYKYSKAG